MTWELKALPHQVAHDGKRIRGYGGIQSFTYVSNLSMTCLTAAGVALHCQEPKQYVTNPDITGKEQRSEMSRAFSILLQGTSVPAGCRWKPQAGACTWHTAWERHARRAVGHCQIPGLMGARHGESAGVVVAAARSSACTPFRPSSRVASLCGWVKRFRFRCFTEHVYPFAGLDI